MKERLTLKWSLARVTPKRLAYLIIEWRYFKSEIKFFMRVLSQNPYDDWQPVSVRVHNLVYTNTQISNKKGFYLLKNI